MASTCGALKIFPETTCLGMLKDTRPLEKCVNGCISDGKPQNYLECYRNCYGDFCKNKKAKESIPINTSRWYQNVNWK